MNEVMLEGAGYFKDPPKDMEELITLRKFVDWICEQAWDSAEMDCADVQNKLEDLGLIELRPIIEEQSIDGEKEHFFTKWTPKECHE